MAHQVTAEAPKVSVPITRQEAKVDELVVLFEEDVVPVVMQFGAHVIEGASGRAAKGVRPIVSRKDVGQPQAIEPPSCRHLAHDRALPAASTQ